MQSLIFIILADYVNLFKLFFFSVAEAILLGFQHFIVMLGTTVIIPTALVPQMGGDNVILQFHTLYIHIFSSMVSIY